MQSLTRSDESPGIVDRGVVTMRIEFDGVPPTVAAQRRALDGLEGIAGPAARWVSPPEVVVASEPGEQHRWSAVGVCSLI